LSEDNIAQKVGEKWFKASLSMDLEMALSCLDENVEWISIPPVKGISDILPWIGTWKGVKGVLKSFEVFRNMVDVTDYKLLGLIAQRDQFMATVRESGVIKATGRPFVIEYIQWFHVDPSTEKITRYNTFVDPSPIIAAMITMEKAK